MGDGRKKKKKKKSFWGTKPEHCPRLAQWGGATGVTSWQASAPRARLRGTGGPVPVPVRGGRIPGAAADVGFSTTPLPVPGWAGGGTGPSPRSCHRAGLSPRCPLSAASPRLQDPVPRSPVGGKGTRVSPRPDGTGTGTPWGLGGAGAAPTAMGGSLLPPKYPSFATSPPPQPRPTDPKVAEPERRGGIRAGGFWRAPN